MKDLLKNFTVNDSFLGGYEKLIQEEVIPYQERVLNDLIPDVEKSHAIENFRLAAKLIETGVCEEEFYGMPFQDSDVAKWLEAAAYSLLKHPNEELEQRCDEVIDLIGRAQQKDGYLNTYFTVKLPDKRWTNLQEGHELYCAGHMMEAAVAYAESTGKTKLIDIMSRMTDHVNHRFIEEKTEGFPGHPEVELALMRMHDYTKEEKYKKLAQHFIDVRGADSDYYIRESSKRNWSIWGSDANNKEYTQCHAPVREQTKAVGHAVRAVYLYTGMADVAMETKDTQLKDACKRLWNNITQSRMYVTGAIGSAYEGETFTEDYHLPNDTAYAETCASIGLIFFARKMLELEKDGSIADVMERELYNCVLAGMQLDGKRFFYVNPLEVIPGISGKAVTHRHSLPERPKWYACACCPPNVARVLSSIGRYAWSEEESTIYSHLFVGGTLDLTDSFQGKIKVSTQYPHHGKVVYRFEPNQKSMQLTLAIRLPEWSTNTLLTLNGKNAEYRIEKGYAYIKGDFTAEDELVVELDLSVKRIFASSKVSADNGKVAVLRGPLVYCAEGMDNEGDVLSLKIQKESEFITKESDKFGGIVEIHAQGYRENAGKTLYSYERSAKEPYRLTLIPYYCWGNRGLNQMRVWLPEE